MIPTEKLTIIMYVIGIVGTLLFLISYLPDMIASIKADRISGVTCTSLIILIFALSCAIITNLYFGNYPFVINDVICIYFNVVLLRLRIKKGGKRCLPI